MKNVFLNSIAVIVVSATCAGSALACTAAPQMTGNSTRLAANSSPRQSGLPLSAPSQQSILDPIVNLSVTGLWDVKFYDATGQILEDEAYEIFHDDGTEMMTDTSAPATDNVCVGVYQPSGLRTWKLKHISFVFDLSGNLTGTAIFNTTLTLESRGNAFAGNTTVTVYDTNGNVLYQATGPVRGTRITVN